LLFDLVGFELEPCNYHKFFKILFSLACTPKFRFQIFFILF
jgi:hypothetical protein